MSLPKFVSTALVFLALAVAPLASGQDAAKSATPAAKWDTSAVPEGGMPRYIRPETPEQRQQRLSVPEDPGINPDPDVVWHRFGKQYKIARFEKKWAKYTDVPGLIKPMANVNFIEELYQENDQYVWVWLAQSERERRRANRDAAPSKRGPSYRALDEKQMEYIEAIRPEFEPLEVPKSPTSVRFENSSTGLPAGGSWRNSLAVADMNGDGKADVILPPERAGRGVPAIFLGDGTGKWTRWTTVKWPSRLNYGSVVAADFNKDKHMDLAFGIHLSGIAVLLGDGKGGFREAMRTTDYPTRRIVAEDVDADGWMDVVAISEGPVLRQKDLKGAGFSNLRAYINRERGAKWEGLEIAGQRDQVSGDWLAAGDFNGDGRPDFAGSNVYFNSMDTLYVSTPDRKYERVGKVDDMIVPSLSYYWANTAGRFSARDRDDAIVSYTRRWVARLDPNLVPLPPLEEVIGIDRISFVDGKPVRTPITRWDGKQGRQITGLSHGDFDGDGHQDVIYTRLENRKAYILFGDGRGGFRMSEALGLELPQQKHYDLTVADVNGDRRPDVVVMYEAQSGTALGPKNGKVEVFLNRGATRE
jgi:hypothetical protein